MRVHTRQRLAIHERSFHPFIRELARFESTRELEGSDLYRKLKTDIESLLEEVWQEQLVDVLKPPLTEKTISAVAWNIERGMRADAVARLFREHQALNHADVLLLSELDWGMA